MNDRALAICEHASAEVRRKIASNGSEFFGQQCTRCGSLVGSWLPKSKVLASGKVSDWDESLQDCFYRGGRSSQHSREESERALLADHAWYHREYLHSVEWQIKRQKVLERDRYTCQGCGSTVALQVHHRDYSNVGDELLFQLITLCNGCHERAHKPRTSWRRYEVEKRRWLSDHPNATPDEFDAAMLERARKLGL